MNISKEILDLSKKSFGKLSNLTKKRFLYEELTAELTSKSITILSGPRGVGKSTLLKQVLEKFPDAFYLAVDLLEHDASLFDYAQELEEKYKIKYLIFDEIHFNENYVQDLKKIYDFLDLKIFTTSSVSISLKNAAHDLSRRAKVFNLYPFSFREFIYFEKDILLEELSISNILKKKWSASHAKYYHLFHEYLKGRLFAFTLEEARYEVLFKSMLEKIINQDIAKIGDLTFNEIKLIEKIVAFIAKSGSDGVSYNAISKNLGITIYKTQEYLNYLEQAYVIHILFPKGKNVTKEPKVLMFLPYRLLFCRFEDCIGALREDFVILALHSRGMSTVHYLKSLRGEKVPDFIIETENDKEVIIEVGGKGKGTSQFKGIKNVEKYILADSEEWKENQIPLFMLGMN